MKLMNKTKGAVSIFLVIILVPMMTFSALFVDYSKVKLSKGVLESAGDLTLNTALTDYDTQLKDLYGLFGTAQNTEDLFSKLEEYYRTSIISSGVDPDSAADIAENLMAQLGLIAEGEETTDLLNMNLIDFDVSKVNDADLANAAVLKDQIVEFEKYRAPINTGLSFVSALKSFSSLKEQTELVEKRKEYYETEQSVMKICSNAWSYINEYNKSGFITDDNYFANMKTDFNNAGDKYSDFSTKIIKNYYDSSNNTYYKNYERWIEWESQEINGQQQSIPILYNSSSGNKVDCAADLNIYSKDNPPTADELKDALISFHSQLVNYRSVESRLLEINTDNLYNLQFLLQTNRHGGAYFDWVNAFDFLYDSFAELQHTVFFAEDDVLNINDKLFDDISAQTYGSYYDGGTGDKGFFAEFAGITSKFSNEGNSEFRRQKSALAKGSNDAATLQSDIETTSSEVFALYQKLSGYGNTLSTAKENLENAVIELEKVKTMIQEGGDLSKAKGAWQTATNASQVKNTSMARQDQAEIQSLSTYLNSGDLQKLIDRLNNIIPQLGTMISEVESYKYFGTSVIEIYDYDNLVGILENNIGSDNLKNVPLDAGELDNKVNEWISGKFTIGTEINYDWSSQSGTQAKLAGSGTDKLNFYSYLYTHFNQGDVSVKTEQKTEDTTRGEDLYKNIKTTADSKTKANTGNDDSGDEKGDTIVELKDSDNRPSKDKGENDHQIKVESGDDAVSKTSKNLGDMFGSLGKNIAGMGKDLRDKIYVTDYITGMFSYDTIEKELAQDPNKAGTTPKSITKQDINKDNNAAYTREVEYIIYGGSNTGNVTKAYASIYAIRLGFNLIYAFMSSEIRETALAIATPISAATLGIVPVPLIQAAIIIGVSCVESGIDLAAIKEGKKVVLFKSEDTWRCSIKGLVQTAKEGAGELLKEGVDAGSNILGEMLDQTDGELDSLINEKTDEFENKINSAYDSMITDNVETVLQQFTGFVRDAVQGEMMGVVDDTTEYVEGKLDTWLSDQPHDGMIFNLKSKAVDLIKSKYIGEAVGKVKSAGESITSTVDNYANELTSLLNKVRLDIDNSVIKASDELKSYKSQMIGELKESAKGGAQKLKNKINEKFGSADGGALGDSSDGTGLSSILKFAYSDYLKLFVLIGLFTDQEGLLLRTADAIQANMSKVTGSTYDLRNSAVYLKLDATVQVKPTLLALPLFADVSKNPVSDTSWYTVNCKMTKGY